MATLKYGVDAYNIEVAPDLFTVSEARAEYNRLRNIANKRLWNLKKSEFSDFKIVQKNLGKFYGPSKMTEGELYKSLQDVARFVTQKTSTVKGIKSMLKKEIATLQEHDYTFVNDTNILAFRDFWEEIRANNDVKKFDSEEIVELYEIAKAKKVDPSTVGKAFEYWIEHTRELKEAKPYQGKQAAVSAKDFERLVKGRVAAKKKREAKKAAR